MTVLISTDDIRPSACRPGMERAARTAERGRKYSVPELLRLRAGNGNVEWLLFDVAKRNAEVRAGLQRWATSLGIEAPEALSLPELQAACVAVYSAKCREHWADGKPERKGVKLAAEWYYGLLAQAFEE